MLLKESKRLLPREKLIKHGAKSLSDSELLALFLRTGRRGQNVLQFAEQLLTHFGSLYLLMSAGYEELNQIAGLGPAKYTQLKAVLELSYRYLSNQPQFVNLSAPEVTYHYLASRLANQEREIFVALFLDHQNQIIQCEELFYGTYNSVEIHPREIVKQALKYNATAIILAHNHPSGKSEPSHADRMITQQIEEICGPLEIRVIDHIVIGKGEYVSFAERGWL